ncbi:MAG: alcohol dehydrogenase catalytic domain-containing protein [Pseudomonadota bacterium]
MRALVYTGPEQLELSEMHAPTPGPDEILIDIEACGICGSDMHAWHGRDERRPAPLILGHEAVGKIADGPNAGQRVAINPLVACQTCEFCRSGRDNLCTTRQIISMPPRQGAFAAQLVMPPRNLVAVPDHVDPLHAALCEPLACGWHAVRLARHAYTKPIEEWSALVIGGGAIGLGAALVLRMHGAREIWIAETNAKRHPALRNAGDFPVFAPQDDDGPVLGTIDVVVDAVGLSASRRAASAAVRPGGTIVHIGLGDGEGGLDVRRMTLHEIAFIGTYTYTAADFADTADAIFSGRLGALDWTDVRDIGDGAAAFHEINTGVASAPKIILTP